MKKIFIIFIVARFCFIISVDAQNKDRSSGNDRQLWLTYLDKLAKPVLSNLAEDKLKEKMPVVLSKTIDNADNRSKVAYLEAFARTLSGIAPWLNLEGGANEEIILRNQYRQWSLKAIANAVNPSAKDYMKWNGGQPLVDASYIAFAFIRYGSSATGKFSFEEYAFYRSCLYKLDIIFRNYRSILLQVWN